MSDILIAALLCNHTFLLCSRMLLCELQDVYFAEAAHAQVILEMLRNKQKAQTLLEVEEVCGLETTEIAIML